MFHLKAAADLRPYQKDGLDHMFVKEDQTKSGIIVLPCGAGKTLLGVAAAARIKKSCLVLCTSSISVDEWKNQFMQWTNLKDDQVMTFTSNSKTKTKTKNHNNVPPCVVITTFSMMGVSDMQKRSYQSRMTIDALMKREWGLLLLDEVHVAPADTFRTVIQNTNSVCKLGLTATLVREDDKILDLDSLVGPKLYEASWKELMKDGYIATTHCTEVKCPMTDAFASAYANSSRSYMKQLLSVMNPNKFRACQHLIESHSAKGDKIIVFSDNIWALTAYAKKLNRPLIEGKTTYAERSNVLKVFKEQPHISTIFLSKIGDNSLNIPEANVLIQISSHAGSRRQEAQRLGRVSRAKNGGGDAFFYSLVSEGTEEEEYSSKRQQFLVDHGYNYNVIACTDLLEDDDDEEDEEDEISNYYHYSSELEQADLLADVLKARSQDVKEVEEKNEENEENHENNDSKKRKNTCESARGKRKNKNA